MNLLNIGRINLNYNEKLSKEQASGLRSAVAPLLGFLLAAQKGFKMNEEQEYKVIWHLLSSLAEMCDSSPSVLIDILTGHLWCEEEAGRIRDAGL
jgi:hypothetical protein